MSNGRQESCVDVRIPTGTARLEGVLELPAAPRGAVARHAAAWFNRHL